MTDSLRSITPSWKNAIPRCDRPPRREKRIAEEHAKEIVSRLGAGAFPIPGWDGRFRDSDTVAPGPLPQIALDFMAVRQTALTPDLDIQIVFRLFVLSPAYLKLMEEKLDEAVADRDEAQRKKYAGIFREEELAHIRTLDNKVVFGQFRQTHRYGYVIHIFSILESSFRDIWKGWRGEDSFDTLGRDLIERLNSCYQQANPNRGKIPATLMEPIQDIVKVRNCIVHHSGHVTRSKHKKHLTRLNLSGYGVADEYIWLEKEFCEWALKSVQEFYSNLSPVFKQPLSPHLSKPSFVRRLLNWFKDGEN